MATKCSASMRGRSVQCRAAPKKPALQGTASQPGTMPHSYVLSRDHLRSSEFMMPMRVADREAGPNVLDSFNLTDDDEPFNQHHARGTGSHAAAAAPSVKPAPQTTTKVQEEDIRRYMVPQAEDALDIAASHFTTAFMCGGLSMPF